MLVAYFNIMTTKHKHEIERMQSEALCLSQFKPKNIRKFTQGNAVTLKRSLVL